MVVRPGHAHYDGAKGPWFVPSIRAMATWSSVNVDDLASGARTEPRQEEAAAAAEACSDAIPLMVYGLPDDPDGKALSYIEAAHAVGIRPMTLRGYFHRADFVALALKERRAHRASICIGNEGALKSVRDGSGNDMARIRAVLALEELSGADAASQRPQSEEGQRFSIAIVSRVSGAETASALTIESRPIASHTVPPHAWPTRAPGPSMSAAELPIEPELIEEPESIDTPRFRLKRPWER
jgi:hypothetical protein